MSGKRAGQPEVAFGDKILDIVARSKYVGKMLITDYIKEDLSARLRSGQTLPTPLTIDAISEHYNVSFSPVRTAIAELIDEGLVVKGANRRLIAVPQNRRAARSAKSVRRLNCRRIRLRPSPATL